MNDQHPDPGKKGVARPASSVPPGQGLPEGVSPLSPADVDNPALRGGDETRSRVPPGPQSDRYLGCTIDNRYKVESIIGEGGMGVVYQCRHKIIDKRVALKILRSDLAKDREVTERFLMEAKAASAIHDEHIISISDFGQLPDGAAYFVMEFLEGTPLSSLAGGGMPMTLSRILTVALQLTEGLSSAHRMGIVHRDLKPDNVVLITRGKQSDFVKILDFGIAKVSSSSEGRLTQVGSVFGTPHYMSPEQAAGTPLDHRGDIYSLGIMLYELATGDVPFDAENFVGILSQQLYQQPVPPRTANPGADIPAGFEAIILKCLEKSPDDRYQSMVELRDDLHALQAVTSLSQHTETPPSSNDLASSVEGTALSTHEVSITPRPLRWPVIAAFAAPLTVVALIFAAKLDDTAGGTTAAGSAQQGTDVDPPAARPLDPPAASPSEPDTPLPVQVLLAVTPASAHVFNGTVDLGESPVSIDVTPGSIVTVELRHEGYATRRVALSGDEGRLNLELTKLTPKKATKRKPRKRPVVRRKRGSKAAKKQDTPIGGQLFVEPWQKP